MPKNDFLTGGYSCDHCGKNVGYTNIHNGGFIVKEQFCSVKCKNKWNEMHSGPAAKTGGFLSSQNDSERELSPEENFLNAEEERLKRQEEREALARDRDKAEDLKDDGKKWLAMWYYIGQNGRIGIGIGEVMALFIGLIALTEANAIIIGIILLLFAALGLAFGVMVLIDFIKLLLKK